jgi:hypothetical protein
VRKQSFFRRTDQALCTRVLKMKQAMAAHINSPKNIGRVLMWCIQRTKCMPNMREPGTIIVGAFDRSRHVDESRPILDGTVGLEVSKLHAAVH